MIGGIIATNIVRYDVYGTDVVIANKMESEGEAGKIHLSEATKKLLEGQYPGVYKFSKRRVVNIEKLKTTVNSYFLLADGEPAQPDSLIL